MRSQRAPSSSARERGAGSPGPAGRRSPSPLLILLVSAAACQVDTESAPPPLPVPYACQSDADCALGQCLAEGFCARDDGELRTLLIEVTPRAADPVYGGARYYTTLELAEATEPRSPIQINVPPRIRVRGTVSPPANQEAECLAPPSLAESTIPVNLTFTPRERLLGSSVPSYQLSTRFDLAARDFVFEGSLPPGSYDVYMQPDDAELSPGCRAIPQLFRNQSIDDAALLQLQPPAPASLRLDVEWRENLDGWTLDMVHPVTGEVISNRVRLSAADVVDGRLVTTLDYSRAENDYIPDTGEELVRLLPPAQQIAGTVLLQRSGLELLTPGEGVIGNVSSFGDAVDFQAWVWKQDAQDSPVSAQVSFAALDLDEVDDGVIAAFSSTARVDERGLVRLALLPGEYRVRVTPPAVSVGDLGLLAGSESNLTVWPASGGPLSAQAGQVIQVPPAPSLDGFVLRADDDAPIRGVEVRARSGTANVGPCRRPVGSSDADAGAVPCERTRGAVLRDALAEDPFVPRSRAAYSGGNGRFEIHGLDCGQCRFGSGARFEVTARPPHSSGLPWMPRTSVNLYASDSITPIRMPVPMAARVRLTYGGNPDAEPGDDDQPRDLAGALVRAYAVIDDQGSIVDDLESLTPCVSLPSPDGGRCLRSLLELAEMRSDEQGELLLLLPPSLD